MPLDPNADTELGPDETRLAGDRDPLRRLEEYVRRAGAEAPSESALRTLRRRWQTMSRQPSKES